MIRMPSYLRRVVVAILLLAVKAQLGCAQGESVDTGRRDRVVDQVDAMLLAAMERAGVEPADRCTDSEFLRRVYLDLSGQLPRVSVVRDFLASDRPGKREYVIDQLMGKPKTFDHLAEVWRNAMLPNNLSPELLQQAQGLQAWLRDRFAENFRYDRVVSDIVATTESAADGPALFFTALDLEPKRIAAATARMFLGLQLECAECHDHPFDDWKQEAFWGYAAFFARLPRQNAMTSASNLRLVDRSAGEVTLPNTEQVVMPSFPGGRQVGADEPGTRRQQLSIWMASPENPYLARAAVNRVWALLFGRGLVEPVDDLGPHNAASHPELLNLLTQYFRDTGYDLHELLRTLCRTQAYQRSSDTSSGAASSGAASPPELFAVMPVKVLSAEQLYDSLYFCLAATEADATGGSTENLVASRRFQFIAQMSGRRGSSIEFDRSIQQALQLMNGPETSGATTISASPLLQSLHAPFLTDGQRMDILYLSALTRYPTAAERERNSVFLEQSMPAGLANSQAEGPGDRQAWADLLWVLVNSAEFALNH